MIPKPIGFCEVIVYNRSKGYSSTNQFDINRLRNISKYLYRNNIPKYNKLEYPRYCRLGHLSYNLEMSEEIELFNKSLYDRNNF